MTKLSRKSNALNLPTHAGIIVLVVAVSVTGLTLGWAVSTLAQQCQPTNVDNLSRFSNKPRDGNGNIHVTVNYSAGTEASNAIVTRAMQSAIAEWNTYSSSTHVVFDPATPGQQADLDFYHTVDASLTGGCAHFSDTGRIFHGAELEARLATMGEAEVAVVLKHEVGHFLGLAHTTSPATIMNQPPVGTTCSNGTISTKFVFQSDAIQAGNCIATVNPTPTPTPAPTPTPDNTGGNGFCTNTCPQKMGWWQHSWPDCQCEYDGGGTAVGDSPIIIDVAGNGFDLTDAGSGVNFDLDNDGVRETTAWTALGSDESFLVCWIETPTVRSITAVNCSAISQRNQRRQRVSFATAFLLLRNTINRKTVGMATASLTNTMRSIRSCVCGKTATTTACLKHGNCIRYLICRWTQYR